MNAINSIKQYKALLDDGIINQSDFDKKKNELLANSIDKGDPLELLKEYKELLDLNAIDQKEYDLKKRKLLDQAMQASSMSNTAMPGPFVTNIFVPDQYVSNKYATPAVPVNTVPPIGIPKNSMQANAFPPNARPMNENLAASSARIKKLLIVLIGIVTVGLVVFVCTVFLGGHVKLNDDEQYVLNCIKNMPNATEKEVAENLGDVYIVKNPDKTIKYVVINYYGTRGYVEAVFIDGVYYIDANDSFDTSDFSSSNGDKLLVQRNIRWCDANLQPADWEVIHIDTKKLKKAIP